MSTGLAVARDRTPPSVDDPQAAAPSVDDPRGRASVPAGSARTRVWLRRVRGVLALGWVVMAAAVLWGVGSGTLTSVTELRELLSGLGVLAPVVYTLVGAAEAVFPVVPGSVTVIAGPVLFGPVVGLVAAYCATCLGSVAVFALSRYLGQDLLTARFRAGTVRRWLGWLQHRRFTRWFAIGIALPLAPDDLLCCLAGLSRMRWRTFVLLVLLLKPWALVLYTFGVLTVLGRWIPGLTG
ncbi:VTT domain-containing protein [uncultured Serinicoccus sp.]|uniref:TVP38/TMEM64 family protein n=1 Tax=uncultured Serinicoccus sp. TaxID=735514 RepID=UPI00260D077B|nr:VTT domain-containing protein [uncultured Serinicoccus sp.]